MMDSEIEKSMKMENQLQKKVTELFAENRMLESKISVLNECLSLEKVKQKISDLENKQKILKNLEGVVNKLKTDIKPLEYLKQVLQEQLRISSLSTNDYIFKELKNSGCSQLITNSGCAIETLDSLSDVSLSSEESIEIISDDDVFLDNEDLNSSFVNKSKTFDEALMRASVVHSLPIESSDTKFGSIEPSPNEQPISRDRVTLMYTSDTSEEFLKMFDIIKEQDLLNDSENNKIQTKIDAGKIEPTVPDFNQLHIAKETLENSTLDSKECDNPPSTLLNSWVQVNEFKSIKTLLENKIQKCEDLFQAIIDSQKNKITQKVNIAGVSGCVSNDQLCFLQSESKNSSIKGLGSDYINMDHNDKNIIDNPVFSTIVPKYELLIKSSMLNTEDSSALRESDKSQVNTEICEAPEVHVQIDQSYNRFESNESCENNVSENICSYVEQLHNDKIETYNPSGFSNVQKDEIFTKSLCNTDIEGSKLTENENNLSSNINVEPSSIIDKKTSIQPYSINEFDTTNLNVDLLNSIHQHGYHNLTSLQLLFLSHCLSGQDMIFYSYPCVGKSTICLISVLQRINTDLNECQAIVLVPTLVLAESVQKVIESLGKFLNVSTCIGCADIFGKGSPIPHVVVSTPRDMSDMINSNLLCKDFIRMLVIDDADEMFKCYGFCNQIRNVLLFVNHDFQLIVVSSSKLEEMFDLFSDSMKNTAHIIMHDEKPFLEGVFQYYVNVSEEWKFGALYELHEILNLGRAVVYCKSWDKCREIAENQRLKLVSAVHNKMASKQRQTILEQFRSGTSKLLVTTELLKGEDFSYVEWVINYDFSKNPEEYVRRIVGFFGRSVKVINFITPHDTIIKENIETAFKMQMLYFPQNTSDLRVPDILDPVHDVILST